MKSVLQNFRGGESLADQPPVSSELFTNYGNGMDASLCWSLLTTLPVWPIARPDGGVHPITVILIRCVPWIVTGAGTRNTCSTFLHCVKQPAVDFVEEAGHVHKVSGVFERQVLEQSLPAKFSELSF